MTKEQLEAIWNGTDIGWLKRQGTATKKKTERKMQITFYKKVPVHVIEETVFLGKKDTLSTAAYVAIGRHYNSYKEWPSDSYEIKVIPNGQD